MSSLTAPGKINLALVVGERNADGFHEVATVLQRIDLSDTVTLEPADRLAVDGFEDDTIVRAALEAIARAAGITPCWRARIEKRIPVAAGLGGGSSDAAAAIRLANDTLPEPLDHPELRTIARSLGADVPFFLEPGPQLGTGDGSTLRPLMLPQDYLVLLVLPGGAVKESTGAVYGRFERSAGFAARRDRVVAILEEARTGGDLADLPPNDLASSPLAADLLAAGAFRADVSGAGPTVYGLFEDSSAAQQAAREFGSMGRVWLANPAW